MLVLPTRKTPILCQGITSPQGTAHTEMAIAYGSAVVAGTSRDKRITRHLGVPVFPTVKKAVQQTRPQISLVFSTPARALKDVEEAIRAKIPLIICTTEHVPLHDILKMKHAALRARVTLLGPASPGIVRVGECLAGNIPAHLFPRGAIGIMGRSSSLIYEAAQQLAEQGLGVSTCVALGALPLVGTSFVPILEAFLTDRQTRAVLVIGQLHGRLEKELAAFYARNRRKKPVFAYIPGSTLPASRQEPLLGTRTLVPREIIAEKQKALKKAGIIVIKLPNEMGATVAAALKKEG